MAEIAIIDYGMGNLHSVAKAVNYVIDKNSKVKITSSLNDIRSSSHIIFPGQGAVSECMLNISKMFSIEEFIADFFLSSHEANDRIREIIW